MAAPLNTCTTIEQRGVGRILWAKNMEAKDIHKEMLPIWAAFLCDYPLLHPFCGQKIWKQRIFTKKCCPYGQHFFVIILCCIHIFCPQKRTTPRCSIVVHVFRGAAIL
jgi:hypothetical protein